MSTLLKIQNLHAKIGKLKILNGINLSIRAGEIHFIMGPNGSGKSTLALTIMGDPRIKVTKGKIYFQNKNITRLEPNERAKLGIFLGFQNPIAIEGLFLASLINTSANVLGKKIADKEIDEALRKINLPKDFLYKDVNYNMSGGEKKKAEALQLLLLKPRLAILDEFDTGLDVDALRTISKAIKSLMNKYRSFLIITHYSRIVDYIKPDKVHIMVGGKIVKEGNVKLAKNIEKYGYAKVLGEKYAKA